MSENTPEGERGEEKCAVWGGKERRKHCYSDLILCLWGRTVSVERWWISFLRLSRVESASIWFWDRLPASKLPGYYVYPLYSADETHRGGLQAPLTSEFGSTTRLVILLLRAGCTRG